MIDIFKSNEGQDYSARFFVRDKLNLNPAALFVFFITVILLISMSQSFNFSLSSISFVLALSVILKSFRTLFFAPINRFKIFLIFSFAFSLISTSDFLDSFNFLLKVATLIILSVWFNYFVDFKAMLNIFDNYFSRIKPIFIRKNTRKILFSTLLGLEFVSELFSEAKTMVSANKLKEQNRSVIKKNGDILINLFYLSFNKALEMEKYYTEKEINFENHRVDKLRHFNYFDIGIFLLILSLLIISFRLP